MNGKLLFVTLTLLISTNLYAALNEYQKNLDEAQKSVTSAKNTLARINSIHNNDTYKNSGSLQQQKSKQLQALEKNMQKELAAGVSAAATAKRYAKSSLEYTQVDMLRNELDQIRKKVSSTRIDF